MSLKQPDLWEAIQHPKKIRAETVEQMETVVKQYPYFQLLHTLIAKAKHDQQTPDAYAALGRAAIYAPDRRLLRRVFYDELTVVLPESEPELLTASTEAETMVAPGPELSEKLLEAEIDPEPADETNQRTEPAPAKEVSSKSSEEQNSDSLRDELAETLRDLRASKEQTAKSSSTLEYKPEPGTIPEGPRSRQQEIIDRFVAANPQISRDAITSDRNISDLSAQSSAFQDDLVTENLAEIMLKQGKTDKAVALYKKLTLKYPEKKAYFAQKIDQLKNT